MLKVFAAALLLPILVFEAKVFERCEFVDNLIETHFFGVSQLAPLTCIATWASGLNSSKETSDSGKNRYGIMQIDDVHGCDKPAFGLCGALLCDELLDQVLRDDLLCTRKLYFFYGFEGWPEWQNNCKGQDLSPYTDGCIENHFPVIEASQTTVFTRYGINEKITCNVTGDYFNMTVRWVYNTTKYPLAYTIVLPRDPDDKRISIELKFKIVNFIEEDVFTCVAVNTFAEVTEDFLVQVKQFPKIVSETKVLLNLTQKDQALTCKGTGHPAPVLKWIYNETEFPNLITRIDQQLTDSTSLSLIFPSILYEVAEFICEASNQYGNISEAFTVNIKEPPQINISTYNNTFYAGQTNQFISCTAMGYPLPSLKWIYNENIFPNLLISPEIQKRNSYVTSLKLIFPVADFKTEYFVCIASNMYDQFRETFEVTVVDVEGPDSEISKNLTYIFIIAIAVVLIASLVIGSLISYRRFLLKHYLLTDEEVKNFKYGAPSKLQKYFYHSVRGKALSADVFHYLPYDQQYELKQEELRINIDAILGDGNFGVVFEGECKGRKVAVKIPKEEPNKVTNLKSLLTEIKVMIHIGEHLHVVNLIGAITKGLKLGELYVAVDYCELGDLEQYLRNNKQYFDDPSLPTGYISGGTLTSENEAKCTITYLDLLRWCSQVASGMAHLEKMKVIHGDLATRNILLYRKDIAKVSDFGLSKKLYAELEYVSSGESKILPWRWMAIESLTSFSFCSKSDVWSFGVTLWEIFSLGEVPYPGLGWSQDFPDLLKEGMRLMKPIHASQEIYETMLSCWKVDHNSRPDFHSLFDTLLRLKNDVEYSSWKINVVPEISELEGEIIDTSSCSSEVSEAESN